MSQIEKVGQEVALVGEEEVLQRSKVRDQFLLFDEELEQTSVRVDVRVLDPLVEPGAGQLIEWLRSWEE